MGSVIEMIGLDGLLYGMPYKADESVSEWDLVECEPQYF